MNPQAASSPAPRTTRHTSLWSSGNLASINAPSTGGHFLFQSGGQVSSFVLTTARVALIGASRIAAKSLSPLLMRCLRFINHSQIAQSGQYKISTRINDVGVTQ